MQEVRLTDFIDERPYFFDSLVKLGLPELQIMRVPLIAVVCAFTILALEVGAGQVHMIRGKHNIAEGS